MKCVTRAMEVTELCELICTRGLWWLNLINYSFHVYFRGGGLILFSDILDKVVKVNEICVEYYTDFDDTWWTINDIFKHVCLSVDYLFVICAVFYDQWWTKRFWSHLVFGHIFTLSREFINFLYNLYFGLTQKFGFSCRKSKTKIQIFCKMALIIISLKFTRQKLTHPQKVRRLFVKYEKRSVHENLSFAQCFTATYFGHISKLFLFFGEKSYTKIKTEKSYFLKVEFNDFKQFYLTKRIDYYALKNPGAYGKTYTFYDPQCEETLKCKMEVLVG